MAGRNNHIPPPNASKLREVHLIRTTIPINDPRLHPSAPARSHLLEDRIAIQHREIQSLLVDNQRLAATHVALKQELALSEKDIRHLSTVAADVKAERDAQVRDVYERSLKLDAEVRAIDAMNGELVQVRADVQKLGVVVKQELAAQLEAINGDLAKVKKDTQVVPAIKAEIETFHKEIQRGRAAIEFEKKTHASNLEQSQVMEKNMIAMAREIEKLRVELANAEKRARAAAAAANPSPGYSASYSNTDVAYGGSPYPDPYGMHQVQGGADAGPQYVPGATPHAPYDMQRTHVHR